MAAISRNRVGIDIILENAEALATLRCGSLDTAGPHPSRRGPPPSARPPKGEGWLHEIKHDGHSLVAILDGHGG